MKRISVTTLETFRRMMRGDPLTPMDAFVERLRVPFCGNGYTRIGTAFHAIVELGTAALLDRADGNYDVAVDGGRVTFNRRQVESALSYRLSLPLSLHEAWLGRTFHTPSMDIWVHGRMDVLHGIDVHDIKTKFGRVRVSDYMDSAQWRLYLDLAGLDRFVFDFFVLPGYVPDRDGLDVSAMDIEDWGELECVRYAGMDEDNAALIEDFTSFVVRHGLAGCLKDHVAGEN